MLKHLVVLFVFLPLAARADVLEDPRDEPVREHPSWIVPSLQLGQVAALGLGAYSFKRALQEPARRWGWEDTALELSSQSLIALDIMYTADYRYHPWMYERNPLVGRHPSDERLVLTWIASSGSHALISALLPKKYRAIWQTGVIQIETFCVANSIKYGLTLRVPL